MKENYKAEDTLLTRLVGRYVNNLIDYETFEKAVKELYSNKKDSKLTLKEFDLEDAKAGKPVCTRDGRKARIICFDYNGETGDYPIVALVHYNKGNKCYERVLKYTSDGLFNKYRGYQHDDGLMMVPEKKEGWVNVYKVGARLETGGDVHSTKDAAIKCIDSDKKHIATVKVEWEE